MDSESVSRKLNEIVTGLPLAETIFLSPLGIRLACAQLKEGGVNLIDLVSGTLASDDPFEYLVGIVPAKHSDELDWDYLKGQALLAQSDASFEQILVDRLFQEVTALSTNCGYDKKHRPDELYRFESERLTALLNFFSSQLPSENAKRRLGQLKSNL